MTWFRAEQPKLDWLQVEVTTRCDARCSYCPRTAYGRQWTDLDLPLETFRSLVPQLKRTGMIHLQGWGEPLLHPKVMEMIQLAKQTGARVGTTSNANRLTPGMADELVRAGPDVIGLSLAGTTPAANDPVRQGTSLDAVQRGIEALDAAKARLGSARPSVHLAFMLVSSRLDELEKLPGFVASLPVDQVVVSSLALVPSSELIGEAVLAGSWPEWADLNKRADEVQEQAASMAVDLECQFVSPIAEPKPCDENVLRAAVIGADGQVSPCIMTALPIAGRIEQFLWQRRQELSRMAFGSIAEQSLKTILNRPDYKRFRRGVATGRLPAVCRNCLKSRVVSNQPRQEPAAAPVPYV